MEKASSNSFSLNISVMKVIGLYPSDSHQIFHKAYAVNIYILAMMPPTVLGILHFIFTGDFTNFKYNDFMMVQMTFYTFKFFPLVKNNKKIKTCIHYFDEIYYSILQDEYKKTIIEECVGVCRRNSKVFFTGCIVGYTCFIGQLVIKGDFTQLPLNVWLPTFVIKKSLLYYSLYFILILGVGYASLICGTIDPLIGGLAYHATAQLQILKIDLQNLDLLVKEEFSAVKDIDEITKSKKFNQAIKNCILHYQAVINFVREYQECFSFVVFSQFVESGVTIGILLFQISQILAVDINFLIMMNYLNLVFFQIFFYCYYGQLLIEENKTLSTAVYMSKWYEYNIHSKRALIILMERSQRPMVVMAGNIFDLSLDTFTTILKKAYSLLAVLRNY